MHKIIRTIRQFFAGQAAKVCRIFVSVLLLSLFVQPQIANAEEIKPEIIIQGGSNELKENIRQYLSIAAETCTTPSWKLKSLLKDADNEIQQAAQALGFYQLTYTSELSYTGDVDSENASSNRNSNKNRTKKSSTRSAKEADNNCWQLKFVVEPGAPVKISQVTVQILADGETDPAMQQLQQQNPLKVGDVLNHGVYEKYKNLITNLASSHGYFDGHFEQSQIFVDTETNTALIVLIYDTGQRYKIGAIHMQHQILGDEFVGRYLSIKTGDYYDTDKLLEQKTLFNATNYFSVATASPDLQHIHDHQVPIDISLEERKRYAYELGAGFATDTGARVSLGFEDRYLNDSGHNLKVDLSQSRIKKSALVAYSIPMANPVYEFLKIYTGYEREETDTSFSKKNTYGSSYSYYPGSDDAQPSYWLHTYAVNMENEWSALVGQPLTYSHLIIPSLTLNRVQTDATPYPRQGWNATVRLSGSPQSFGSDLSYLQFYARAKRIFSFADNDCALCSGRLILRTELGATQVNATGGNILPLPISVRFFAGGDNSVRGYEYKSLGPMDADKKVIGGNNLWVNSAEYDFLFKPKWALAAFYDVGNAADDFHWQLKRGAGLGVRWISPIGPVRVDVARALDAPFGWQLHITMGPDL